MDYIGHPLQIRGVEQVILQGGKSEGMHFLIVRNGIGLEAWISLDRCSDLMRVTFKGTNMGFMSACGNVSPLYYDCNGTGFLKSFTSGFFTTAGLNAVGSPCTDDGENLPLHGTIANTPSQLNSIIESDKEILIDTTTRDCCIFGRKFILKRKYIFSLQQNYIEVKDTVINDGDTVEPFMILYHCNMGYPLLDENSIVKIPNNGVEPRNQRAKSILNDALKMEIPQSSYEECCYYYDIKENNCKCNVGIYNEKNNCGVILTYDKKQLPYFTEWKMMGKKDYVLGLEPGNCLPDGRNVARKNGKLIFLQPNSSTNSSLKFDFVSNKRYFINTLTI